MIYTPSCLEGRGDQLNNDSHKCKVGQLAKITNKGKLENLKMHIGLFKSFWKNKKYWAELR